jgi:hypothetical protein
MKKAKFKVGDRVELTSSSLSVFFRKGTKFGKGVVEKVDGEEIKVQRDNGGILYRGHEDKWWCSNFWRKAKAISGLTPDERYDG